MTPISRGSAGGNISQRRVGGLNALWRRCKSASHGWYILAGDGVRRQRAIGAQDRARINRTPPTLVLVRLGECHCFSSSPHHIQKLQEFLQKFLENAHKFSSVSLTASRSLELKISKQYFYQVPITLSSELDRKLLGFSDLRPSRAIEHHQGLLTIIFSTSIFKALKGSLWKLLELSILIYEGLLPYTSTYTAILGIIQQRMNCSSKYSLMQLMKIPKTRQLPTTESPHAYRTHKRKRNNRQYLRTTINSVWRLFNPTSYCLSLWWVRCCGKA